MKCEICKKNEAQTALTRDNGEELYVCNKCLHNERVKRMKRSQCTRGEKKLPPEMSMSIAGIHKIDENEEPPPFVNAIMSAFSDMIGNIGKAIDENKKIENEKYRNFSLANIPNLMRIGQYVHLEGLYLLDDLDAVMRAAEALNIRLVGVDMDGITSAGQIYTIKYNCTKEQVMNFMVDLMKYEFNSRLRLCTELPRVLGDSVCRSLAILKNCRLLAEGDLLDMLSPIRLATMHKCLEGITIQNIDNIIKKIKLKSPKEAKEDDEVMRINSKRADDMNKYFKDIVLSGYGAKLFL